ncbi:MAG: prepilin-type N-terminal cleavage/methylation domain-containing protein [Actinomycetota bacterium]
MYKYATNNNKFKLQGFTLIELLVVIAIIGLLATIATISLNNARMVSRDAKRKSDFGQIRTGLEMYYDDYGRYPQAGACGYGANCYVYSTSGTSWMPALTTYLKKLPVDPINKGTAPWNNNEYLYAYGNVWADGSRYDLTTQLESKNDPDRCEIKNYKFYFDSRLWCGAYSKQIYDNSP